MRELGMLAMSQLWPQRKQALWALTVRVKATGRPRVIPSVKVPAMCIALCQPNPVIITVRCWQVSILPYGSSLGRQAGAQSGRP